MPTSLGTVYIGYKFYIGSYQDLHKSFKEIDSIASLSHNRVISIYYDNPDKVIL